MVKKIKVLHIDDSKAILTAIGEICRDPKVAIEYEGTVEWSRIVPAIKEARAAFLEIILITDLEMSHAGGINGDSVAKSTRKSYPDIPIIIFTGNPENGALVKNQIETVSGPNGAMIRVIGKREKEFLRELLMSLKRDVFP